MPLTATSLKRSVDPSGSDIKVLDDGASKMIQAMALMDDTAVHAGIQTNPLRILPPTLSRSNSTALENSRVVKVTAGVLYEVAVVLDPTVVSDRYVHVLNQTIAPAGGETPVYRELVEAGKSLRILIPTGLVCSSGIVVGVSTTILTHTIPGGNEAVINAGYV
jgi:hypothetical protein